MRTRTVKDSYGHAIFAAPVAIWLGLLVESVIHYKSNGVLVLIFWHTLLCVYLLFGSLVASAPFAYVVLKIKNIPKLPNKHFYSAAIIIGSLCATSFIFQNHIVSVVLGLLLNMLYFTKLIKENET